MQNLLMANCSRSRELQPALTQFTTDCAKRRKACIENSLDSVSLWETCTSNGSERKNSYKTLKFLLLCLWIFCSHAEIEKLRKFVGNRSSRTNLPFVINAFAACKLLFSLSQALTEVRSQYAYAGIKCAWMLPQDEANITKLDNFRFKTLKLIANMLGSQEDLLDCWKEYKWSNAGLLKLFCSATPFQKRFF